MLSRVYGSVSIRISLGMYFGVVFFVHISLKNVSLLSFSRLFSGYIQFPSFAILYILYIYYI